MADRIHPDLKPSYGSSHGGHHEDGEKHVDRVHGYKHLKEGGLSGPENGDVQHVRYKQDQAYKSMK